MKPSILSFVTETPRAIFEMAMLSFTYPSIKRTGKQGSGLVVTVPGFTADDHSMVIMRNYLAYLGYECVGWGQGQNLKLDQRRIDIFSDYISNLTRRHNKPVHLIGHSLGGIFAREAAKQNPDAVSSVITLGTPFMDPENSATAIAKWLYDTLNRDCPSSGCALDSLMESIKTPPSCSTTCFFSKWDGIVHWSSCMQADAPANVKNVHINMSHTGMVNNPAVLYKISEELKNVK